MVIIRFLGRNCKDYRRRQAQGKLALARQCPRCQGPMHRHGYYQRGVDTPDGQTAWLRIQRMRCRRCRVSHAVLPHFLAPYQRMSTPDREAVARLWVAGPACSACRKKPAAACVP